MSTSGSFIHNPNLTAQIPAGWTAAAENIAAGYTPTTVVEGWHGSAGHYANIMGGYTDIGIGYSVSASGQGYFTQDFGTYPRVPSAGPSPSASQTPTPSPTASPSPAPSPSPSASPQPNTSGAAGSITDTTIADYFTAKGGAGGPLGYPLTATIVTSAGGGGKQVAFQGGLVESSTSGTFLVTGVIRTAHGNQGGVGGPLGWPTGEQSCGLPNGGCSQPFQHGTLLATTSGAAGSITDTTIADYFTAKGGAGGPLGYPLTATIVTSAGGGGKQVAFQGGLVESSTSGTFLVTGVIRTAHGNQGGVGGPLGWPTGEQSCGLPNGGCSQPFQHGTLLANTSGAAGSITDTTIADYFTAKGGAGGPLGYPLTATIVTSAGGGGKQVAFQGGLVESSTSGTFLVTGVIRTAHGNQGGVGGPLGWPTGEQSCGLPNGGCSQPFQHGTLLATTSGAAGSITDTTIADYFTAKGGAGGPLGYPLTATIVTSAGGGGKQVAFQGGLVESSTSGTFLVTGVIRTAHGNQGGVGGPLGWPTGEQSCGLPNGGCSQPFQHGTLLATTSGAAGSITDTTIADYFTAKGGAGGPLGYPLTATIVTSAGGGGKQVAFQGGLVESSTSGTFLVTGVIRTAHGNQGGVGGPLGWPTGEQSCGLPNGGCSQPFQHGTLLATTSGAWITPISTSAISNDAGEAGTGVPAGTALTVVRGDIRVSVAGTVLDSLDVHGIVFVDAPNVTIRNSIIRGSDSGSQGALITATGGYAGLNISNSELFAAVPSAYVNGIMGFNFTATRVNIHNVIDMVHLTGNNVSLTDSWLHDNLHYEVDPTQGNTPSHDDSVQIQVGSNIQIRDNKISGAHNSGVQITQNRGSVNNVQFTGNTIDGGGCSFNISEGGKGPVTGVTISNNIFGRNTKVANCAVIAPSTSMPTLSNDHYTDGATVVVHRGS